MAKKGGKRSNCPSASETSRKVGQADARKHTGFESVTEVAGDPLMGGKGGGAKKD